MPYLAVLTPKYGNFRSGKSEAQQDAALLAHRLRHGQHQLVAARRADHCQRDAGVAAGRFDDLNAGFEQAFLFGIPYHVRANPAFY